MRGLRREGGRLVVAQVPDHRAHLGQRPRRLGLDHAQGIRRRGGVRRGRRQSRLRADGHGGHVMRDGVMQVPGQSLAFQQPYLVQFTSTRSRR